MWRQKTKRETISLVTAMDILFYAPIDAEPVSELEIIEAGKLLTMMSVCLEAPRPLVLRPATAAVRVFVRRAVVRLHAARCALGDGAAALIFRVSQQRPIGIIRSAVFFLGAA